MKRTEPISLATQQGRSHVPLSASARTLRRLVPTFAVRVTDIRRSYPEAGKRARCRSRGRGDPVPVCRSMVSAKRKRA